MTVLTIRHDRSVAGPGRIRKGQIVRFPAYRRYEAIRTEASNAMMALLAGAQLASHLLQLTEGSARLLPEMFPRVDHIRRFNLTTEGAREILLSAGQHLGAMSVPYALAIHEDYMKTCLEMLAGAELCTRRTAVRSSLAGCHGSIEVATGDLFDTTCIEQIDVLRKMRNCMIHAGGRADSKLVQAVRIWSPAAESNWIRLAKRNPRGLAVGDAVTLSQTEMILALAVTKALAREANVMLQKALPRDQWADVVVTDMVNASPRPVSRSIAVRTARGLARFNYRPLALSDTELAAALGRQTR